MDENIYDIQKLMLESGVPRRTIHFYVQQGVLPPPQGAGLAAYYTQDHLLRLRLIPVLRRQGLRLDEIRERFAGMTPADMRRALDASGPLLAAPPPLPSRRPAEWPGWAGRSCTLYQIADGVTLTVQDDLKPADRQRLQQLLEAARRIFAGPPIAGKHPPSLGPEEGGAR